MNALKAFQKRIGYKFRTRALLEAALTHPSHRHEGNAVGAPDNQRLEFLGDAVLEILTADHLYHAQPELAEGAMTQLRSQVANRQYLADIGRRWELGPLLRLGRGEAGSGGADRESNLADAVEAVLGAVYLDGGMKACQKWFKRHIAADLTALWEAPHTAPVRDNPKGALQEWAQGQNGQAPVYRIVGETGPAHNRQYEAAVEWDGRELARGTAPSKRAAEAAAADAALDRLQESEAESG